MPATRETPTTRMRELGERLRSLRMDAGYTVEGAAAALLVSASKISRLEKAVRRPSSRDVRDLCSLYGVSDEQRDLLMSLAAQAQQTSWYQEADHVPGASTFIGLEQAASHVFEWTTLLIPGLLQTDAYARRLIERLRPEGVWSAEQVDEIAASRARRRAVLENPNPPRLHVVLDELILRRPVGDPDVMTDQLSHLVAMSQEPHITIQVVPASAGAHPGLDGPFIVLTFADHTQRDVVYTESATGALFVDKESVVRQHRDLFDYLATRVALDEAASLDLLRHF